MLPNPLIYPSNDMPEMYTNSWASCPAKLGNPLPYNDGWEDSIAISQSTSINAPFNTIDYIFIDSNGNQYKNQFRKSIQKIGLYAFTGWENSGSYSYTNSGAQSTRDFWHICSKRRKGGNDAILGSLGYYSTYYNSQNWSTLRNLWSNNDRYYLVTRLNAQNVLGVIYVGFVNSGSNISYCSLKDYLTNYSSLTPNFAFMVQYIERPATYNNYHAIAPIDLVPRNYDLWKKAEDSNTGVSFEFGEFIDGFPPYMTSALTKKSSLNYATYKTISNANVFPLCGLTGVIYNKRTFEVGLNEYHGIPIFGAASDNYTIVETSSAFTTQLTEECIRLLPNIAATYGLPFTDDYITDEYHLYNGDKTTYIPTPNGSGYFNGAYETLTTNGIINPDLSEQNQTIWNGGTTGMFEDRTYTPDEPTPTNEIQLTEPTLTAIDCFNRSYIINRDDVDTLGGIFWSANDSILTQIKKAWELFGEKPINGVINLILFPFDVRSKTGATSIEHITIGEYDTEISAYRIPQTARAVYDLGQINWNEKYNGSFLDYTPYTEAELYIPFFGVMPLPNEHFLNKTIDIKLVVDFITGAGTAVIYVTENGARHPVIYKNATIGIQVPVSGDDVQNRITSYIDNALKVDESIGNIITGVVGKNPAEVAKGIGNTLHPTFEPSTMYQTAGSSTPECSLYLPIKPYLILYRPNLLNVQNYGHLVGFATSQDVVIGECVGLAKFGNLDLTGITATSKEKELIQNLLESGVYL